MSISSALSAGVSGLAANSTRLSNISDNIAKAGGGEHGDGCFRHVRVGIGGVGVDEEEGR